MARITLEYETTRGPEVHEVDRKNRPKCPMCGEECEASRDRRKRCGQVTTGYESFYRRVSRPWEHNKS